jgi:peptidyl-prolyl cis-trans isomerase A (cyclophilin A)
MKKKKIDKGKIIAIGILTIAFIYFLVSFLNNVMGDKMKTVVMQTNKGEIEIELYEDKAPISVENFLLYVESGFFEGTIFHRVIPGFMVQCGGFTEGLDKKETREPIKNEADNGLKNEKYTLAMARTSEVDSATSQFFINTANNDFLDNGIRDFGYAVFGKVVSGQGIVDEIENVKTTTKGPYQNVPVEPILITKVFVK